MSDDTKFCRECNWYCDEQERRECKNPMCGFNDNIIEQTIQEMKKAIKKAFRK